MYIVIIYIPYLYKYLFHYPYHINRYFSVFYRSIFAWYCFKNLQFLNIKFLQIEYVNPHTYCITTYTLSNMLDFQSKNTMGFI